MYNKAKRILGMIAGILSIVAGGFSCFCGLFSFIVGVDGEAGFIAFASMSVGLGIPLIITGSKLSKAPVQYNGVWEDRKKLHISLIVILAIISVYSLFALVVIAATLEMIAYTAVDYTEVAELMTLLCAFHYLNFILVCFALPLNIVSMCLKATKGEAQENPTIVQKDSEVVFSEFEQGEKEVAVTTPSIKESDERDVLDEKVKKLKQWKEEGIITEEQYEESIQKLLNNIVD